ncbi:hypothetical protein JGU71_17615 [Antrihabitans sp. YC3-6]|uniref:Uncharacterized protein n=1 Tax=Antrihabitans stalagmiti TaxID=2799499 RepID=A0A934U5D3_9NOCA|nr:DUF6069 family protein [Antrihabitans stalagmiti]MBJ8340713.1 hypothetical protein [Antrihabitans stalagmiti]
MTNTAPDRLSSLKALRLSRVEGVVGTVLVALVINLVIWLIGLAAGASYDAQDGDEVMRVAPGGVIFLSTLPTIVGMTAAALLSLKWTVILRVAQVVGPVLAIATIATTATTEFDSTTSQVFLSLMHVALAAVLYVGLEGMRRNLAK